MLDHRLGGVALAQAAELGRANLRIRQVGNIHVQQPGCAAQHLVLRHGQHQVARLAGSGLDFQPVLVHLRKGNGRHAKQIAFHGRTHGAGINGVVAHIGAVVDARDHQVWPVVQQARECDVHAVGRRAVHVTKTVGAAVHVQRGVQGKRVGLGAVVVLGGDDFHLGHVFKGVKQGQQAGRLVAVVVGNEDFHKSLK